MAQDATGRGKRVHSAGMGYVDDDDDDTYYLMAGEDEDEEEKEYYRKKIMELYEENMKKFARQDALAEEIHYKERKKSKRPTKKKKMQQRRPIVSNQVTQRLKQFITNEMNGKEAKVVIQKTLFPCDLREDQSRLNIPIRQLETTDFLTENEKQDLENGKGLVVELLGPKLKMHKKPMVLKMWHLNSTSNYVLIANWNDFVTENKKDLKETRMIQVWSFRKDEKLCFAIACNLDGVESQNDAA